MALSLGGFLLSVSAAACILLLSPLVSARPYTGATHNHFRCFQDRAYLANGYYESLEGYDVIRAHCHRGFKLVGSENRICDHVNQRYTGEMPICVDVNECFRFEEGSGGDGWDDEDDTMELEKCHPNATCTNMVGSYKCRCNTGLVGNGFRCAKLECPALSPIPNGRMLPLGHGTIYKFFCDFGFRITGYPVVQCIRGRWNRNPPQCIRAPTRHLGPQAMHGDA